MLAAVAPPARSRPAALPSSAAVRFVARAVAIHCRRSADLDACRKPAEAARRARQPGEVVGEYLPGGAEHRARRATSSGSRARRFMPWKPPPGARKTSTSTAGAVLSEAGRARRQLRRRLGTRSTCRPRSTSLITDTVNDLHIAKYATIEAAQQAGLHALKPGRRVLHHRPRRRARHRRDPFAQAPSHRRGKYGDPGSDRGGICWLARAKILRNPAGCDHAKSVFDPALHFRPTGSSSRSARIDGGFPAGNRPVRIRSGRTGRRGRSRYCASERLITTDPFRIERLPRSTAGRLGRPW